MKVKQFNKRKKIKITKENRNEFNFKEVALTKMAKRQLFVTLLSIIGVTVASLGSAYAVFTSVSKSADYNVIKVGTLNIDFGADSSNTINLSGQYPVSDEEGMKLTPYVFTITNTGTLTADYEVFIQDDTDMIGQDNCSGNQLNKDYIRYKLDEGTPTNLSSIAGSNYRIATGTLAPEESVTYTLYVWIRAGVGNDVLNKHYHGKIVVNGTNEIETAADTLLAKVNAEDLDYNSATDEQKKEMWAFSHPATEQTEALTDYRYIGADPNNYVTFNNEIWRIIGVFTVDDGAGNKEERLKIIRDESIGDYAWNSNSYNDWTNATLNTNLNSGDYWTNSLNEDAKSMIDNAVWYLGGISSYTNASNGLTSNFYSYERGTTVYSGRSISWTGKVGLMYPSDYGYATSGGNTYNKDYCLNSVALSSWNNYSDCYNNNWLFNSSFERTITQMTGYYASVFQLYNTGQISGSGTGDFAEYSSGARPTIYLKANVQIVEGDGSSSNPYILAS